MPSNSRHWMNGSEGFRTAVASQVKKVVMNPAIITAVLETVSLMKLLLAGTDASGITVSFVLSSTVCVTRSARRSAVRDVPNVETSALRSDVAPTAATILDRRPVALPPPSHHSLHDGRPHIGGTGALAWSRSRTGSTDQPGTSRSAYIAG